MQYKLPVSSPSRKKSKRCRKNNRYRVCREFGIHIWFNLGIVIHLVNKSWKCWSKKN